MDYQNEIRTANSDPQKLEQLYLAAKNEGQSKSFQSALLACYEEAPHNLLYAAWYYRLQQTDSAPEKTHRGINWALAVPLSILTGLIF
jgi:hypothetical protein